MTALGNDPLDAEGPAAPPRANGELVFTAAWQSRLFATTMRLQEQGLIEWERFRQGLIAAVADHEADLGSDREPQDAAYDYWGCWQTALELVVADAAVIGRDELEARAEVVAARPPDH